MKSLHRHSINNVSLQFELGAHYASSASILVDRVVRPLAASPHHLIGDTDTTCLGEVFNDASAVQSVATETIVSIGKGPTYPGNQVVRAHKDFHHQKKVDIKDWEVIGSRILIPPYSSIHRLGG
ncbi:hypothetical protein EVAR_76833_1 [Eumeta japonica]|uniref:Uncharacterized protein n=1 Tax=Eumeta variegata TaxID=151549 RepID=A0A4C1YVU7_EUMVA|nr:hypothetical protein EVAR_76833_1 [Eumeta japonica]